MVLFYNHNMRNVILEIFNICSSFASTLVDFSFGGCIHYVNEQFVGGSLKQQWLANLASTSS